VDRLTVNRKAKARIRGHRHSRGESVHAGLLGNDQRPASFAFNYTFLYRLTDEMKARRLQKSPSQDV
jgi:hypothetical protein